MCFCVSVSPFPLPSVSLVITKLSSLSYCTKTVMLRLVHYNSTCLLIAAAIFLVLFFRHYADPLVHNPAAYVADPADTFSSSPLHLPARFSSSASKFVHQPTFGAAADSAATTSDDEGLRALRAARDFTAKLVAGNSGGSGHASAAGSGAIMPPMGNSSTREELGRATWRLIHTMATRFPAEPTATEQVSLELFLLLLGRLYPCGDCAADFQKLLTRMAPDVSCRALLLFCILYQ